MKIRYLSWLATGLIVFCMGGMVNATSFIIDDVPAYTWHYGCVPTSAGMLLGYYDQLHGYQNVIADTTSPSDMIATPFDNEINSLWDFMGTSLSGATSGNMIIPGLEAYIAWDDPMTTVSETYNSIAERHTLPNYGAGPYDLTWDLYVNTINKDQPVILEWLGYDSDGLFGHATLGIGYNDFGSTDPLTWQIATYTTWSSNIDWWYFDSEMSSYNPQDCRLSGGIFVDIQRRPIPEPATMLLLGTGFIGVGILGRKRFKR